MLICVFRQPNSLCIVDGYWNINNNIEIVASFKFNGRYKIILELGVKYKHSENAM